MWQQTYKLTYNHPVNTDPEKDEWRERFTVFLLRMFVLIRKEVQDNTSILQCGWKLSNKNFLIKREVETKGIPPRSDSMVSFRFFSFTALNWTQASFSASCLADFICMSLCLLYNVMWGLNLRLSHLSAAFVAGTGRGMLHRREKFKGKCASLQKNPNPHKPQLQTMFVAP